MITYYTNGLNEYVSIKIYKSTKSKTWVFEAENVRDFAFATSRKFIWDAQAVDINGKNFTMSFNDNGNRKNSDIKNNRLELLKMFCNVFNNFINFSKLEGIS